MINIEFIQNVVSYDSFKLIDGFSGEINQEYLQNVTIADGTFGLNTTLFSGDEIKKIKLDSSVKFLGLEPLKGSNIEIINISIDHYPLTGTLGLEQNKFNGLT
jgi:hypothetical protein